MERKYIPISDGGRACTPKHLILATGILMLLSGTAVTIYHKPPGSPPSRSQSVASGSVALVEWATPIRTTDEFHCIMGSCKLCYEGTWDSKCWHNIHDYRNDWGVDPKACVNKCRDAEDCTSIEMYFDSGNKNPDWRCIQWLNGACDIDTDNGEVWSTEGQTCKWYTKDKKIDKKIEPKSLKTQAAWKCVASIGAGLSTKTQHGRTRKTKWGKSKAAAAKISTAMEGSLAVAGKASVTASLRAEITKSTTEVIKTTITHSMTQSFTCQPGACMLWQWRFSVTNTEDSSEEEVYTDQFAQTASCANTPKCIGGYCKDASNGCTECVESKYELD